MDLNLLVVLDALLEERNVSRAANRVGLSQPAASHALRRLRSLLDDPLLIRGGRSYMLSARAHALRIPLRCMLSKAREVIGVPPTFDPASAEREMRVIVSSSLSPALLEAVYHRLATAAPGVTLHVLPVEREKVHAHRGLGDGEMDMAVGVFPQNPRDIHKQTLYRDSVVCLLHRAHPLAKGPLTMERLLCFPHLLVSYYSMPFGPMEIALAGLGQRWRIGAHLPDYALVPSLLERRELIATIPRRIAEDLTKHRPLVVRDFPLPLPSLELVLIWHASNLDEPVHAWVREQFSQAANDLAG